MQTGHGTTGPGIGLLPTHVFNSRVALSLFEVLSIKRRRYYRLRATGSTGSAGKDPLVCFAAGCPAAAVVPLEGPVVPALRAGSPTAHFEESYLKGVFFPIGSHLFALSLSSIVASKELATPSPFLP